ncbi:Uncharacterised protein [Yersinia enterocolitica]|uniref:Uncharacterized protein n=1 Tax=Proteus terrae subsp. cibarius TaxID=626774 RepID=A0ABX6JXA4_9GAMM|nr:MULTISPECIES: hypothetical protein [Enterobacterales]MBU5964451.1 hypothetical protein [Proteus mirabilis]QGW05284.1 hypothetical protein F9282_20005 [Proteus terrae subsp. cibarius]QHD96443.1 hypothetical protein GSM99_18770 [Proteus terrae subsp. cibarius]QIF92316.1 hypothetical protein GTH23_19935 [Proteus terrae subsp. cibarius]QJW53113.1 hypothetical protein HND96_19680 [Proteus terrae subsp. cibarius]
MIGSKLVFCNGSVSVNDVFVSSWGYEQTNVNFYQVISVHGKKTVTVREIRAETFFDSSMSGKKQPILNDFIGEPLRRQIKEHGSKPLINIEDFEVARLTSVDKKHDFSSWY